MSTILEKIYAQRALDVEQAKSTPGTTPADLDALLALYLAPPLIPLIPRLTLNPGAASSSPSLMAEIKRASPSKGPIALTVNAAAQAQAYALAGASVISVLTEPTWFKGSLQDMRLVRQAVAAFPNRPAILRKDFILDTYQIAEARLWGADTVLLIVAMLSPEKLSELYEYSVSLGMEPLVEVNNAPEMQRALELGAKVIGVNNRNLHDFMVDMGTTSRLAEMLEKQEREVILCSLSGISTPADVRMYKAQGVRAVLVGESLMRAQDTGAFIRELLDWPTPASTQETSKKPWIKVTGIRTPAAASALASKVEMLTFDFRSSSKHYITPEATAPISASLRSARVPPSPPPSSDSFLAPEFHLHNAPWFTAHLRALRSSTTAFPLLVGIFDAAAHTLAYIQRVVSLAQLDLIQIEGPVDAGWIAHLAVPVIRAGAEGEGARSGEHALILVDAAEGYVEVEEAPGYPVPFILRAPAGDAKSLLKNGGGRAWAVDVDVDVEGGLEAFVQEFKSA